MYLKSPVLNALKEPVQRSAVALLRKQCQHQKARSIDSLG
jgi:hypothetical protein